MEWQLRPAVSADRDFLFQVHRLALGPYIERTWGWDEGEQRAHFDLAFDAGGWQVILADGSPAGMIKTTETQSRVYLDDIEILPPFQRKGLGTSIVSSMIVQANADGKDTALQVLRVNPARGLYERLGFEMVGQDDVHIRMRRPAGEPAASVKRCVQGSEVEHSK